MLYTEWALIESLSGHHDHHSFFLGGGVVKALTDVSSKNASFFVVLPKGEQKKTRALKFHKKTDT